MPYMMIHRRVKDFEKWKQVFDEHGAIRKAAGSKGGLLLRNADDPNDIVIIWEWDALDNARKFVESPDLRETMQHAGVTGAPEIVYFNQTDRPPEGQALPVLHWDRETFAFSEAVTHFEFAVDQLVREGS